MLLFKLKYPHKALLLLTLGLIVVMSFFLAWFVFGEMRYFFYDGFVILGLAGLFELYLRIQHNLDTKYESLKAHLVLKEEFFSAQKETATILKNLALFLQQADLIKHLEEIKSQQDQTAKTIRQEIEQNAFYVAESNRSDSVRIVDLLEKLKYQLKTSEKNTELEIHKSREEIENSIQTIPVLDLSPLSQQLADVATLIRQDIELIPDTDLTPIEQQLADCAGLIRQDISNLPRLDFSAISQLLNVLQGDIQGAIESIPATDLKPVIKQFEFLSLEIKTLIKDLPNQDYQNISHRFNVVDAEIQRLLKRDDISESIAQLSSQIRITEEQLGTKIQEKQEAPRIISQLSGAIEAAEQRLQNQVQLSEFNPAILNSLSQQIDVVAQQLEAKIQSKREAPAIIAQLSDKLEAAEKQLADKIDSSREAPVIISQLSERLDATEKRLGKEIQSIAGVEIDWAPISQAIQGINQQIHRAQNISQDERKNITSIFNSLANRIEQIQTDIGSIKQPEGGLSQAIFLAKFQELKANIQELEEKVEEKVETTPHPQLEHYLSQNHEFQKSVVQVLETMEAEIQKQKKGRK